MRILIADDDPVSRRLLQATLARLGHEVVSAATGVEARNALLRDDAPSLAILDWMMPDLDGLDVCRTARERSPRYVYVILLTARSRREDLVAGLAAEADDFLTKPFDLFELQARVRSGERIIALQERLLSAQEALRHEATHDPLTGAWNRRRVLESLDTELARAGRTGSPLTVAVLDVDHFKTVNDVHGHHGGDAVLQELARRVQAGLRAGSRIGRHGGEEFLLVLPDCGPEDAMIAAERVRSIVAEAPFALPDGAPVDVRVSIGLATTDVDAADAPGLIQAADRALYRAKAAGRNRVEAATPRSPLIA